MFTRNRWLGTNLYRFIHLPKQENGYVPGGVNNWRGEKPSDIVFYHLNSILCRLRFNKFCQKCHFDLTHTMRISYSKNFQNRWPGIEILKKSWLSTTICILVTSVIEFRFHCLEWVSHTLGDTAGDHQIRK